MATQSITVSVIGVAVFTVAVVAGQAVSSLVVDRLGFGPAGPQPYTPLRVFGAVLALVAVVLAVSDRLNHPSGLLIAVLPALAGIGTAVQQAINGRVARTASTDAYGALAAGLINFVTGATALARGLPDRPAGPRRAQQPADRTMAVLRWRVRRDLHQLGRRGRPRGRRLPAGTRNDRGSADRQPHDRHLRAQRPTKRSPSRWSPERCSPWSPWWSPRSPTSSVLPDRDHGTAAAVGSAGIFGLRPRRAARRTPWDTATPKRTISAPTGWYQVRCSCSTRTPTMIAKIGMM